MMHSDYIIVGSGASGLMLAYRFAQDAYYDDKSILIIDKEEKNSNDRTWCFWEEGAGEWDEILHKSWTKIFFGNKGFHKEIDAAPYSYKMIRSARFYKYLKSVLTLKSNIKFTSDTITKINDFTDHVDLIGKEDSYRAKKVFNSALFQQEYKDQERYPVLQQHFVGWFIKLKSGKIDDTVATFMDFDIPQKSNTRFMYVLPVSENKALFEYTLFSKDLLKKHEYEQAIEAYLKEKGITQYTIEEKEYGSIPMTSYRFHKHNTRNILNIGTAGGWTKASTGYTFMNTSKKTRELAAFIKTEDDMRKFHKTTKFWFYDLLMLDVLSRENEIGSQLFSSLFQKTSLKTIFRFLDEESSMIEDLKIITAVPSGKFIRALWGRIL